MQASVRGMRASPFLGARRAQLVSSWSSSSSNGAAGDLEQLQCWARVAAFRSLLRCLIFPLLVVDSFVYQSQLFDLPQAIISFSSCHYHAHVDRIQFIFNLPA